MLEVINMDLNQLKDEMKEAKVIKISSASFIKKRFGQGHRYENELKRNELLKMIYSPAKTLPVKVGGVIINYKLYQAFIKKLKGYESRITIDGNCLRLEYWKPFSKSKGTLILEDISCYFEGFQQIPVGKITD